MEILRTKGVTGLYAGLTPSLLEIVPYAGLQFGTYDALKRWTAVRALKMFVFLFALSRQNIFILMPCVHWPWHTFPADLLTDTVGGWRLSNHKLVCSSDLC